MAESVTVAGNRVFRVEIPLREFERLFEVAPEIAFFHVRDTVGSIFGSHRREWLRRTKVNLKDHGGRGLRVQNLDSRKSIPSGSTRGRSFFYKVRPKQKKPSRGMTLADIEGESFTESVVALGQEVGGTVRARRSQLLAIPIGVTLRSDKQVIPRWSSPKKFQRGKRPKETVVLPLSSVTKSKSDALAIFWKKWKRKNVLLPAFLLQPQVEKKPLLRYYDTWDQLKADRDRRWKRALANTTRDIARSK